MRAAKAVLRSEQVQVPCAVEVTVTDDEGIRAINREQRGIDAPTDVLSFPMHELRPGAFALATPADPDTGRVYLGDVIISMERVEAQAEEYGHSKERELCYLTIHSVLHLLGYDHLDEGEDKRLMREKEVLAARAMRH